MRKNIRIAAGTAVLAALGVAASGCGGPSDDETAPLIEACLEEEPPNPYAGGPSEVPTGEISRYLVVDESTTLIEAEMMERDESASGTIEPKTCLITLPGGVDLVSAEEVQGLKGNEKSVVKRWNKRHANDWLMKSNLSEQ